MFIHENRNWPKLEFRIEHLASKLVRFRFEQGKFLGQLETLRSEQAKTLASEAFSDEILATSAIEGEFLDPQSVRSSVASALGLSSEKSNQPEQIRNLTTLMLESSRSANQPLTSGTILSWHSQIISDERFRPGKLRTADDDPMRVISLEKNIEKVHFEAPSGGVVEDQLNQLLDFLNSNNSIDPVLLSGIGHFWMVTIHPFLDGNGRISRLLGDVLLSRADGQSVRYYSVSKQISRERNEYYKILESSQRGGLDITEWLDWYLGCLTRAVEAARKGGQRILQASQWLALDSPLNDRQKKVLGKMLHEDFQGFMQVRKYSKIASCSTDTALRDIKSLEQLGLLIKNPAGGRSTSYRLSE